ncbi:MAG: hypothetical protein J2P20_18260 [Pseudonocardia sp.]|nr:hypothetical protein [Pseudonocardia sp.]MBO0878500.1 hypothetical protein [Pseudonocardia sp.]
MSVLQTVLLYVVVPAALYLLISLLAAGRRLFRRPRYRPGEPWKYPPVWWSANPEGAGLPEVAEHEHAELARTSRGGAHGSW